MADCAARIRPTLLAALLALSEPFVDLNQADATRPVPPCKNILVSI
jgi:hypothetical protein